jgi:hypothetical protein
MAIKRKPTPPFKRKPVEIPANIGKHFAADMRRFHRETNPIKRDEIAGGTMRMLREHYSGRLRVPDVKRMFEEMRDDGERR